MDYKVEDCFLEIRNGISIKQGIVAGGFPITRIETLADDKFNRDRMGYAGITEIDKYSDYVLEDGDLLMSHINSPKYLGRTVVYHKYEGEVFIHGMNLLKLRTNRDILCPDFAEYLFASFGFRSQISKIMKKSVNQASFSVSDLRKISVKIPSLSKQREIINKLHRVKQIVNDRNIQLEMFDELIKSRFVEMFGEPTSNTKMLKTFPMTEVCEIIDGDRGKNYPNQDEFFKDEFCLFLNAKNVTSTGFSFSDTMFISKEKDELLRKGKLQRGDVVLTTRGTIGNLAYYADEVPFDNMRINSGMVILRMKKSLVEERFFIQQFRMQLEDIKNKIASGSAQPQLPISTMNKINILIPKIEEQNQFATFVQQVDKLKVEVQKSLDETQKLFDSLMQKYFS